MPVDERTRHALYTRLSQVLGEDHAVALMANLPPTTVDARLDAVDRRFEDLIARFEARISSVADELRADLRADMIAQTRTFIFATIGSNATLAGLFFAAVRFGGATSA